MSLEQELNTIGRQARAASNALRSLSRRVKDGALIEIAHWYENVMLLGWIFLFFSIHWAVGLAFTAAAFFLMLLVRGRAIWN